MNLRLLSIASAMVLAVSLPAFAQSQQGGYSGVKPPTIDLPEVAMSAPGGYLGKDAGATLKPLPASTEDVRNSATLWCRFSPEPDRCRGRAEGEHAICAGKQTEQSYAACRFAMDQMFSH